MERFIERNRRFVVPVDRNDRDVARAIHALSDAISSA